MKFDPFDVTDAHVAYALLGAFTVLFGMFSLWLRAKLYISEAVWATLFGIIIGPYGAGVFDPRKWGGADDEGVQISNEITLEVMRVVLAIGVFAIGVELPKAYLWHHIRSVLLILFPVMAWGWLVCAALIYGLIPGLDFLSSLIVAACLTPTDPILASAVIGGKWADKHVPTHLRHLLAAESAVNDGLAFPFLYLGIYLFLEESAGVAIGEWIYWTWLYEVILGCCIGTVMGVAFRHLMQFCERNNLIDRTSYVAQYISLALLAIGVTTLLGSDDLLAAFFAGTGFGWNGFFQKQTEDSMFSNAMDLLFNVAAFIYIGAWLPFSAYGSPALTLSVWRLVVLGLLVILVRRLPICIAVYRFIPDVKTLREAIFTGHFGPMGVGAVFISTLAATALPSKGVLGDEPYSQEQLLSGSIQPIVSFIVLCSILVHGLSVPGFSLSKRVHSISRSSWSRHASMDTSGPEWANQARRVHRPEDVVINRDGAALDVDLEKGDAQREVKEAERSGERRKDGAHVEGGTEEVGNAAAAGSASEPPGGSSSSNDDEENGCSTKRWQQGPYLVIERDPGHGEEVEVEVIRDSPHEPARGQQTFRGTASDAYSAGRAYVEKLEEKARGIRQSLRDQGWELEKSLDERRQEEARRAAEHFARQIALAAEASANANANADVIVEEEGGAVAGEAEGEPVVAEGDERDENWVEEGDPGPSSQSHSRRFAHATRRALGGLKSSGAGRRRESFRRTVLGRPPHASPSTSASISPPRRRESPPIASGSGSGPRPHSILTSAPSSFDSTTVQRRLDPNTLQGSRSGSPARSAAASVRFSGGARRYVEEGLQGAPDEVAGEGDGNGNGSGARRGSMSGNGNGTPRSGGSRVRFDPMLATR